MLEALIAATIFSIVALALAGMLWASRTGFDYTSTQGFVQRVGTAVSEEMQREFTRAVALQVTGCGPQVTTGKSVMYMNHLGDAFCIYDWTDSGDVGPKLYRCQLVAWGVSGSCSDTPKPKNLLLTQQLRAAREDPLIQIVARNIRFQWVSCLPNGSFSCGDPGLQVVSPLFDMRFDLDMGVRGVVDPRIIGAYRNTPLNALGKLRDDPISGQRFASSFTTRN
jgi:hypothetical protein